MNGPVIQMKEKVFLVTGGTSGVGKATATGLAKLGAKVVIISRDAQRGQQALDQLAQDTGNDRGEYLVADLSLQSSIKQVSEEFKRRYENLHVLANLAGAVYFEEQLTSEGIERTFAVNYLSHFMLTNQLLDILKASRPSRVITVAGAPRFLKGAKINFEDVQSRKHFSGLRATSNAMFDRVIFAFALARRLEGTGVTSNVFHPGTVRSNLLVTPQNVPLLLKLMTPFFDRSAKETCDIAVYLATAQEVEKVSGVFFDDHMQQVPSLLKKYDEILGNKLWSVSDELITSQTTAVLP